MYFFFFKQKTAYEMRISDWSSDVCSSDLIESREIHVCDSCYGDLACHCPDCQMTVHIDETVSIAGGDTVCDSCAGDYPECEDCGENCHSDNMQTGRASCRERVCPYV